MTKRKAGLPHYRVFTRLGQSRIHGVGVFAVAPIKKGTPIFFGDEDNLVWVDQKKIEKLPNAIRRLYEDFGVLKNGKYGCPRNFNLLTVAWYLNHSQDPNVRCGRDFRFYAARDIATGEELTSDYRTYSEGPEPRRNS